MLKTSQGSAGERKREKGRAGNWLSMAAQAFNTFATKPNAKRQTGKHRKVGRGAANQKGRGSHFSLNPSFFWLLLAASSPPRHLPHSHFECRRVLLSAPFHLPATLSPSYSKSFARALTSTRRIL